MLTYIDYVIIRHVKNDPRKVASCLIRMAPLLHLQGVLAELPWQAEDERDPRCGEYRLAADEPLIKPGYLAALLSDG